MKNAVAVFLILVFNSTTGLSQECSIGDNLWITFARNDNQARLITDQNGFCYSIIQTNRSREEKMTYPSLSYTGFPSRFGNFYLALQKKSDTSFFNVQLPPMSHDDFLSNELHTLYGKKGDSIYQAYDPEKVNLGAFQSDTFCYNLLKYYGILDAGEYRFQVFFRIGNVYAFDEHNGNREIDRPIYLNSDWYYFKLQRPMEFLSDDADKKGLPPCNCSVNGPATPN